MFKHLIVYIFIYMSFNNLCKFLYILQVDYIHTHTYMTSIIGVFNNVQNNKIPFTLTCKHDILYESHNNFVR